MMGRTKEPIIGAFILLSCGGFMLCSGFLVPADIAFNLAVGWVFFLGRVIPEVHVNWGAVATAATCLAGLLAGLHLLLGWFRSPGQGPAGEDQPARRWELRWTLSIVGVVVLMFVAGISAVGITHQTAWLLASPEPLVSSGFDAPARVISSNNLRQIGLAAGNHSDQLQQLPPGCTLDADGNLLHGWQTPLLPYIEQETLFREIDLKVPWSDPRNAPHFRTRIKTYQHPAVDVREADGFAASHYASNARVLGGDRARVLPRDVPDGLANTILAGEAAGSYRPWGHPMNWRDPARGVNRSPDGFGGPSKAGTVFVMSDGSVRTIRNNISPEVLKALSTPDGGESITEDH